MCARIIRAASIIVDAAVVSYLILLRATHFTAVNFHYKLTDDTNVSDTFSRK